MCLMDHLFNIIGRDLFDLNGLLQISHTLNGRVIMKGIYSGNRFHCVAKSAPEGVEPATVGFVAKLNGCALFVWSWECFH